MFLCQIFGNVGFRGWSMFRTVAFANILVVAFALQVHHKSTSKQTARLLQKYRSRSKQLSPALRAEVAMQALLEEARSELSREVHKGMRAPLNQTGYEQALGNVPMTAFILRFAYAHGVEATDANALQGLVMYFDGSCTKRAYKNLLWEFDKDFSARCHSGWIRTIADESLRRIGRSVTRKEFEALKYKESMAHRAAAFEAAFFVNASEPAQTKLRHFAKGFVYSLEGNITDEARLDSFVDSTACKLIDASYAGNETVLDVFVESLYNNSESESPVVRLHSMDSRQVSLAEDDDEGPEIAAPDGMGATAPLNESGYQAVVRLQNTPEMAMFINRTARSMGLKITSTLNLNAFAPWYDGHCASQTFKALRSELQSIVTKPVNCGGGWIDHQHHKPNVSALIDKIQKSAAMKR